MSNNTKNTLAYEQYVLDNVANCIKSPANSAVGNVIAVKSVDENGKPTEYEAVNIPEQVQVNWTQEDETATNYIKNKPSLATSEEIKALFN